ncbi:CFAP61 family protein [Thermohalobacter berrensis]|uniref:CFAP61 family protein n=1 Tax=Thermohalobacter berrensis TaxID=99594 RepID=UPI001FAAC392|nr:CFAP61 family protein [Thermohalobacter berrensis]
MNILIREANIKDYDDSCEIYNELDEYHRDNHPELFNKIKGKPRTKEYISKLINNKNNGLFVAEVDSKIVGFQNVI